MSVHQRRAAAHHAPCAPLALRCSHQPGFQQLKLVRGQKGMSCFIEFQDIPTAMAVHDAQQGAILASSDRGGIRIQYSKNPFGRKRDAAGALLEAAAGSGVGGGAAQPAGGAQFAGQHGGPMAAAAAPAGHLQQHGDLQSGYQDSSAAFNGGPPPAAAGPPGS